MEHKDDSQDFNEWQQIEQHPSPTVHQSSVAWNTVAINDTYLHKFHADRSSVEDSEDGTSEGETPMPAALPPSDWWLRVANEGRKLLKLRFEAMRAGVVRVVYKVRNCAIYVGAFWSILCVTGAATVAVLVCRIRRRRRRVGRQSVDHLTYLLREKDEIRQLALQIAQLNEVISSRRKVPVLRISS
ncbi:PREDICTED: uncharacterized protein LOC109330994 isoform X2 [Lupinus angustifolius]|uniref:uncharacterized protein LOC109330994 isoform X2 n=1 Tax=Lupinus angustifolius TaxID=3871 RepID=UPI00092EB5E1|nr:PREDICTED: uncharacterized protein LOC109330994 isoform X2 [Lupinus angustifolius]